MSITLSQINTLEYVKIPQKGRFYFLKLNKTRPCKRQKRDWVCNTGYNKKTLAEEEQKIFSSTVT